MYDWANSAVPTVIITFVFAAYFTKGVAPDEVTGTALWGQAIGWSALFVAIISPIAGAITDHTGPRKPWLFFCTVAGALAVGALWTVTPDEHMMIWGLVLVAATNAAFETGMVFYNAMLPRLVPDSHIGRVSGWGWATGYAGGIVCLALVLVLFVQTETPLFGLDKEQAEHLRVTGPFVAVWLAIFSIPLFLFSPDKPSTGVSTAEAVRRGFRELFDTFRRARAHATVFRYLIARMIYTDGLNTLFTFGGIYAAGTFGMEFADLIIFGIGINVTAGLGAFCFAWLDDRWGPIRVIFVSLGALIVLSTAILLVEDIVHFWIIGLALGVFIGPVQSASRSLMAHLAPAELRTEMFGLYALSGKATAFLGPMLVGALTAAFDSQRVGMAGILVFLIVGSLLLRGVRYQPK
ncbi:MAG: MFS transporter [Rhodospirillales bacterium]|nr:MFS transporter [Rhodospirillales bacterium]MBO6787671.1 MFS transporter [Rhodospirillales bacterium]